MRYLVVDGELSGTGIRDKYADEYGYIDPKALNLSQSLITQIEKWQKAYEQVHFNDYNDENLIIELDNEGVDIAKKIINELKNVKVEYYSNAYLKTVPV